MDNRPIGVFDSGLGGLTVVKQLMARLPGESIVYFGDTARIPYGSRSQEIVTKYSIQCIRFLLSRNIKMIVIACNTASSFSLDIVKGIFDVPILGVVEPGAAAAAASTRNNKVAIIGTVGTIRSRAYCKGIKRVNPNIKIWEVPCPLFVPIVEEGWSDTDIAALTAERYLGGIREQGVDTLVLGCTHYPLLANTIQKVMGNGITLVDPAEETVKQAERLLIDEDMLSVNQTVPEYSFFVSDFGQHFKEIGSRFLGKEIDRVEKIDIDI